VKHTNPQKSIIHCPQKSHIKVCAGPGVGKSTTLYYRVLQLKELGVDLSKVLIAMFNKPATVEFQKALLELGCTPMPIIRNYHSIGYRLCNTLQRAGYLEQAEFSPKESYSRSLAKGALIQTTQNSNTDCNPHDVNIVKEFQMFIELCKSNMSSPTQTFKKMRYPMEWFAFTEAFKLFEIKRKKLGLRFFPDLIYDSVRAIDRSQDARKLVSGFISHVLLDEYQDINAITIHLINLIVGPNAIRCVVGDDDQCIYSWRGSLPEYLIHGFDEDFENIKSFELTDTFRFGHTLSLLANNLITFNENRVNKICRSAEGTPHTKVEQLYYANTDSPPHMCSEQQAIISKIFLHRAQFEYQEMAILCRSFSISPFIELALVANNIPYTIEGEDSILFGAEFTALLAIIKISAISCLTKDHAKLVKEAIMLPHPAMKSADIEQAIDLFIQGIASSDYEAKITQKLTHIRSFILDRLILKLHAIIGLLGKEKSAAVSLHQYISGSNLFKIVEQSAFRQETADQQKSIINAVVRFCECNNDDVETAITRFNGLRESLRQSQSNGILITSIHRSKGLSYPIVFVPGLSQGLFPYVRDDKETDMPGERRLMYVAVTRAKHYCYLIGPKDKVLEDAHQRYSNKSPYDLTNCSPYHASQFLFECNLPAAVAIGEAITSKSRQSVKAVSNASLYNRYLLEIGSFMRVTDNGK